MRCSVVFGVTLRLLVINISSSSPAINTAAYYQRCVIICETVAVVHRRPRLQHLAYCGVNTGSQARRLRIAISAYPPAFGAPVRGVPVGILLCRLARKNYNGVATRRWKHFDDRLCLLVLTQLTNVTDGQTDKQTGTAWRHRPRLHSIARQKCIICTMSITRIGHHYVGDRKDCVDAERDLVATAKFVVTSSNENNKRNSVNNWRMTSRYLMLRWYRFHQHQQPVSHYLSMFCSSAPWLCARTRPQPSAHGDARTKMKTML